MRKQRKVEQEEGETAQQLEVSAGWARAVAADLLPSELPPEHSHWCPIVSAARVPRLRTLPLPHRPCPCPSLSLPAPLPLDTVAAESLSSCVSDTHLVISLQLQLEQRK